MRSTRAALRGAVIEARPEVVINELTRLPDARRTIGNRRRRSAATTELRGKVGPALAGAAAEAGARRLVAQSVCFYYASTGRAASCGGRSPDAAPSRDSRGAGSRSPSRRSSGQRSRRPASRGLVLRYGYFYGPGTSLRQPTAARGDEVRRRRFPIVGGGTGIFSFIHIDDAASSTVAALDRGSGIYNISDDEPARMSEWLPAFAEALGAKPPRRVPVWLARWFAGKQAAVLATRIEGASNEKAKRELGWAPRYPELARRLSGGPLMSARETLLAELREHALVIGEVTLSSGKTAQYYVDAKRALLRPPAYRAAGELIAAEAAERGATAVGGMTMGADPLACAAIGSADGRRTWSPSSCARSARSTACSAGSRDRVLEPGTRCLVVEDVVTTGGSTVQRDRADQRGGARGRGRDRGGRPARRRRRGDRGGGRRALPRRWSRSTSSTRTGPTAQMELSRRRGLLLAALGAVPAGDGHELAAAAAPRRHDPQGPRRPAAAGLAGRPGAGTRWSTSRSTSSTPNQFWPEHGLARLRRRADRLRARRARSATGRTPRSSATTCSSCSPTRSRSSAPTCWRASSASGPAGAAVAGAAFAFAPYRLEQDGHMQVISSGGIPLALALGVRGIRLKRPWGCSRPGWWRPGRSRSASRSACRSPTWLGAAGRDRRGGLVAPRPAAARRGRC